MTMAELLAEEDERIKRETEQKKQQAEEEKRLRAIEKKVKYEEYLAEREKKRQEALAEKERLANIFEDKTLTCKKCGGEFIWTASEQKFYKEKGFYRPSMCKNCRSSIKTINNFRKS